MEISNLAIFVHVLSAATWLGGVAMMAMYLRYTTRTQTADNMSSTLAMTQRWNLTMIIPTSVLVLLSGIFLLITRYAGIDKPLWLIVKERFGSVVVIAFILLITLYGKKLLQKAQQAKDDASVRELVKRYIMILNVSSLLLIVILFFATMKIS